MIGTRTEIHRAAADLDYGWDLTNWLPTGEIPADTVATVTATVHPTGAGTVHSVSTADEGLQVVGWIRDITEDCILRFHVTTTAGRKDTADVELLLR